MTTPKRLFDIVAGTTLALLATPVIAALALILLVTLRTSPFFVQERIGRDGRHFRFPKLRTLPPSVAAYTDKYSLEAVRIPALCRLLRRLHIDELPQLYLVPIGVMSLVGPRPKMPDHAEPIDPEYGYVRTRVRQGCTGLWQVGAHNKFQVCETPDYDYFYVKHAGLRLDLWILWRTLIVLVGGRTVTLAEVPDWAKGPGLPIPEPTWVIDLRHEPSAIFDRAAEPDLRQPSLEASH